MLCFSFLPYNCISGWQSLSSRSNKAVCLKYTVKRKGEVRMYNFLLLRFLVRFVLYFCLFGCLEPLSISDKKKKSCLLRHWIFFHAMSPVCKQFKYMALSGKDRCMQFLCVSNL